MGRPRKNQFEECSIRFEEGTEFQRNHVKVPFWVNVTFKTAIGKHNNGKKIYGTTTVICKKDISEKDEIIKNFQKEGHKVVKIEEYTIQFSDLCPKCNRKGIPKVERKSNKIDYHTRDPNPMIDLYDHKIKTNRPDEYWLCYDHETEPKKCRVAKWDKNHFIFTKKGRIYTKLRKYMLPFYVEWKQEELDDVNSFQKLLHTVHA